MPNLLGSLQLLLLLPQLSHVLLDLNIFTSVDLWLLRGGRLTIRLDDLLELQRFSILDLLQLEELIDISLSLLMHDLLVDNVL